MEDRRQILSIHLRGMPVEDSPMEALLANLDGFDEGALDELAELLGTDRTVTPAEISDAAGKITVSGKGNLSRPQIRKYLGEQMNSRHLTAKDDAVESLVESIAARTEGYVGSDLEALCREAGVFAMRESATRVAGRHFEASMAKVHPTMNSRLKEYYERIRQSFKGGLPREVQPPEYQ